MLNEKFFQKATQEIKSNPWIGTPLESYYYLNPKNKGIYGEQFVKIICAELYHYSINERTNPAHDLIINNFKSEIKFSAASERNFEYMFTFNHIAFNKDWERIIFCGINGDLTEKIIWFTKQDMYEILNTTDFLSRQQGGKTGENDDYMCFNKKSQLLLLHPLAKSLDTW